MKNKIKNTDMKNITKEQKIPLLHKHDRSKYISDAL